ncbi:MAG TPA: hypothetical protein VNU92_05425 [Edaphobacter sp.]|jgi:hypothetical protein|nr:hypothetical protein [Edaphobacter sp.]
MAHGDQSVDPHCPKPPAYFATTVEKSERLLQYAAEVGIDVDPATREAILRARTACTEGWNEETAANLLAAQTKLAARLKPVTAESLRAYHDDTRPTIRTYFIAAIVLALIIVPASLCTFITSALSTSITNDIARANALALTLRADLGPNVAFAGPPAMAPRAQTRWWPLPCGTPKTEVVSEPPVASSTTNNSVNGSSNLSNTSSVGATAAGVARNETNSKDTHADVIADLQEYASLVRLINYRARKLDWFVFCVETVPSEDILPWDQRRNYFELTAGIPDPMSDRDRITETFQHVRYFAQTILSDIAVFYGALSACILPVLYALLGTCAYLLRTFEDQMSSRTFTPSAANTARFVIAAIGGAVVGLFNNFTITQAATIPPLAIAFLVGYAVDVFFAFLEGLLKAFTKTVPAPEQPVHPQPQPPK